MTTPEQGPTRRVTITVPAWIAALWDPGVRAAVALVGLAAGGFALFGLGWRGAAPIRYVPLQMPWLVSAGLAGIALIGTAFGALSVHIGRRDDAALRRLTDDLVRDAAELAEDLRTGRRHFPGKQRPPRRGRRR